jgi:hypothetical protein
MNRWLTGHTSQRDVLRDMITAVKARVQDQIVTSFGFWCFSA